MNLKGDYLAAMELLCAYVRENSRKENHREAINAAVLVIGRRRIAWQESSGHRALNLGDVDLQKMDLSGGNYAQVSFVKAQFSDSKLAGSCFDDVDLSDCVFDRADLTRAEFKNAILRRASFSNTKLFGAKLRRADLSGAVLQGASLWASDLTESNLSGAKLVDASLLNALLNRAKSRGQISPARLSFPGSLTPHQGALRRVRRQCCSRVSRAYCITKGGRPLEQSHRYTPVNSWRSSALALATSGGRMKRKCLISHARQRPPERPLTEERCR
jgi:hypothetical protein